jgi:hypothetical protein
MGRGGLYITTRSSHNLIHKHEAIEASVLIQNEM